MWAVVSVMIDWSYHKHGAFTLCCFNVGPPSSTLAQHWNSIGWMPRVCCDGYRELSHYMHYVIICDKQRVNSPPPPPLSCGTVMSLRYRLRESRPEVNLQEMLNQFWFNVGPALHSDRGPTLNRYWVNISWDAEKPVLHIHVFVQFGVRR